ncbi:hypothetical protein Tco_1542502, partial [Tanacetum coccineum]
MAGPVEGNAVARRVIDDLVDISGETSGNPEEDLKDYAIIDSGCSGSMTGDKDKLSDFKGYKGSLMWS